MKRSLIVLFGIVLFLSSHATAQPYDSDVVKMSMQNMLTHALNISGALEAGDIRNVSSDFKVLQEESEKLAEMEPPKGSADEWKMMNMEMGSLSAKGMTAADTGDIEQVGAILGEIFSLQKKGHSTFKD